MEGSLRGANHRRYAARSVDFVSEGIEGFVPHEGALDPGLRSLLAALRSAIATAGCIDLASFQQNATLEIISPAAGSDAAVHSMQAAGPGSTRASGPERSGQDRLSSECEPDRDPFGRTVPT